MTQLKQQTILNFKFTIVSFLKYKIKLKVMLIIQDDLINKVANA